MSLIKLAATIHALSHPSFKYKFGYLDKKQGESDFAEAHKLSNKLPEDKRTDFVISHMLQKAPYILNQDNTFLTPGSK